MLFRSTIAPWSGRLLHENDSGAMEAFPGEDRWVGVPRMSALSRKLSENLTIESATPARRASQQDGAWLLETDRGRYGPFDALVAAVPPAQAWALLPGVAGLDARQHPFEMAPCWAVAARFDPDPGLGFEGASLKSPVLDWVALNSSKPARDDHQDHGSWWVLHATPSWSSDRLEASPDEVAHELIGVFRDRFAIAEAPVEWAAHCWRYARPAGNTDSPGFLSLDEHRLGFCGDWLAGGRVEGAFSSGQGLMAHWTAQGLIDGAVPEPGRNG